MHFLYKAAFAAVLSATMPIAFAVAAAADAAPAGIPVDRGADYVSAPSVPEQFYLDTRRLPRTPAWKPGDVIREIPRQFHGREELQKHPPAPVNPVLPGSDVLVELQGEVRSPITSDGFTTPLVNRDGQGYSAVFPPDPSGDVGGGFYVQAINGSAGALYTIYNTSDGSVASGPFKMAGLGSGGVCASGLGDGVVVFDQLARRWLLTEFSASGNNLCIYISSTDNPVATTWARYVFTTPNFPDYPKYGVWTDAYYVGANEGPAVYALDRAKMLVAQPATMQRKAVPRLAGLGFQMLLPASVNGVDPPPAGAPGIFARQNDDERNSPGSNDPTQDFIELFTYAVDWTTPANTTLTGPIRIGQAEFDSRFTVGSGFGAINQPDTSRKLDPLFEVMTYTFHYRNFGDHEALLGNHVTQIQAGNIAGIRWFELRRSGGTGSAWSLHQQGTYAPPDADAQTSRWMGASAMDQSGNIALAYAVARVAPKVYPGLRYTGRLAGDPLGVMTAAETSIVEGGSAQTNMDRWGDYFQMGVDPSDGCTFWFTGMYEPPGGQWSTRLASFRFDDCGNAQPDFTLSATPLDQTVCALTPTPVDLQPVTLTITPAGGFAEPVTMSFAPPGLPDGFAGDFTVNPVAPPSTDRGRSQRQRRGRGGCPTASFCAAARTASLTTSALDVNVLTQVPGQVTLNAPADHATGQPAQPVFSWSASQQVENYRIDIATDATFENTLLAQTLPGGAKAFQPSAALPEGTQLYWRVSAMNLCGSAAPSAVFTFTTQGSAAAAISVTPAALDVSAMAGQVATATLTIGNTGAAELTWMASARTSCLSPDGPPWLSLAPAGGTIAGGDPDAQVTLELDARQLGAGVLSSNLCVTSNDPTQPLVVVPVTFTVTPDAQDPIFEDGFDGT